MTLQQNTSSDTTWTFYPEQLLNSLKKAILVFNGGGDEIQTENEKKYLQRVGYHTSELGKKRSY